MWIFIIVMKYLHGNFAEDENLSFTTINSIYLLPNCFTLNHYTLDWRRPLSEWEKYICGKNDAAICGIMYTLSSCQNRLYTHESHVIDFFFECFWIYKQTHTQIVAKLLKTIKNSLSFFRWWKLFTNVMGKLCAEFTKVVYKREHFKKRGRGHCNINIGLYSSLKNIKSGICKFNLDFAPQNISLHYYFNFHVCLSMWTSIIF